MTSADIKNLSIALEALSRMPGNELPAVQIQGLLDTAINLLKEEYQQTRNNRDEFKSKPDPNDDIPF